MSALPLAELSPLAQAVVVQAVQQLEASSPLDDADLLPPLLRTQPTRAAQVAARAWQLGLRLGWPQQLAHWRRWAGWAALALALLLAAASVGTVRAVLGQGRSINAVAAWAVLLGPHLLLLTAWLLGLAWGRLARPPGAAAGALLGRAALWLAARGPHAAVLLPALLGVLQRQRLLVWGAGVLSHGIWALAFVFMLVGLAFGLAFHAYTLSWESTLLSPAFFQRFVQLTGALPAWLGFAVPDAAAVLAAGQAADSVRQAAEQRAWAWWLLGSVAVYGLLPRVLLAGLSLARWRAGVRRLDVVDMSEPSVRRVVARLDALQAQQEPPEVIDPEQRPPALAGQAASGTAAKAGQAWAVAGFELPPEMPWPLPGLPPGERLAGSADERKRALARWAQARPERLLLVLHATASPDRGTARFVRAAAAQAAGTALLLGSSDGSAAVSDAAAQRWRDWLQAEDLSGIAAFTQVADAVAWAAAGLGERAP